MSRGQTEDWLAALQARFSEVLRTPLDPRGSTLRPELARYPREACDDVRPGPELSSAERLAVYNRQYWIRLLRTLQSELPLTTRLLGPWFFNQRAIRFLLEHPPHGHDIGGVAEGFDAFLERELGTPEVKLEPRGPVLPRAALLQAARLDAAFRRVFLAPEQPPFRPPAGGAQALAHARLRFSEAYALIEEHWPLVRLRKRALALTGEQRLRLPQALPRPKHWALVRTDKGVAHVALQPEHARLLSLLEAHAIAEALGRLEQECAPERRAVLPELAQRWLAQGVEHGFFRG